MIAWALLLLTAQPAPEPPLPPAPVVVAAPRFAPPLDRPMTYRVTTRRLARDGTMASYTAVYALQWSRVGRGIQLSSTLRGVESDARPELARALTGLLQPLVGQTITYLVAPDGSRLDLVDPEGLWQRVLGRIQAMGADAARPEAKQMAALIAALPPAERDRMITSDIRALLAATNPALSGAAEGEGVQTLSNVERAVLDGASPLEIDTRWTVDRATGLVMAETRRNWIMASEGAGKTLVEERLRELKFADPV
ncbi:MAG: hypothetical protein IBJ13_07920 [Sphingopyxis sp.]|nr:hypothetical protein [Sphingopyxis sp.]